MSNYTITNVANGQITLAFDGKNVNFPLPINNGVYPTGADLTTLLDSYVADAQAAASAASNVPVASNLADVQALVITPTSAQLAAANIVSRNRLLGLTDWTEIPSSPLPAATITAWGTYRQALRDLPTSTGWPTAITWPAPPAAITSVTGKSVLNPDNSPIWPLNIVW